MCACVRACVCVCVCVCVLWEVWDYHTISISISTSTRAWSHPNVYSLHLLCVQWTQSAGDRIVILPLRAQLTGSDNIVYKLWSKC